MSMPHNLLNHFFFLFDILVIFLFLLVKISKNTNTNIILCLLFFAPDQSGQWFFNFIYSEKSALSLLIFLYSFSFSISLIYTLIFMFISSASFIFHLPYLFWTLNMESEIIRLRLFLLSNGGVHIFPLSTILAISHKC